MVATLWPVNDRSTAVLVAEFYRLLLTELQDPGHRPARSLLFCATPLPATLRNGSRVATRTPAGPTEQPTKPPRTSGRALTQGTGPTPTR